MNDFMLHNVLGSAVAGIVSRLFTHPLDTVCHIHPSFIYNQVTLQTKHSSCVSYLLRFELFDI